MLGHIFADYNLDTTPYAFQFDYASLIQNKGNLFKQFVDAIYITVAVEDLSCHVVKGIGICDFSHLKAFRI